MLFMKTVLYFLDSVGTESDVQSDMLSASIIWFTILSWITKPRKIA